MAKARSRTAARKMKDRWKAKEWYNILAPASFDSVIVADTLADSPDNIIGRVTEVSLQDLTNDFRRSHIKLYFRVNKVEETNAHTQFIGHTLTSDYLRRLIRRRKSKIDGVYDISTLDGATIRVKPFATTDKRIQNSQKKLVRDVMKKTFQDQGKKNTLSGFMESIIDGKIGREIYKNCKQLYPVKRIEIYKTEVIQQPTIMIADNKPKKEEKTQDELVDKKQKKTKKKKETEELKTTETEEITESAVKEDITEITEEKPVEEVEEQPKKEKLPNKEKKIKKEVKNKEEKAKKPTAKKSSAGKTTKSKTTEKKKTTSKKKTAKK